MKSFTSAVKVDEEQAAWLEYPGKLPKSPLLRVSSGTVMQDTDDVDEVDARGAERERERVTGHDRGAPGTALAQQRAGWRDDRAGAVDIDHDGGV